MKNLSRIRKTISTSQNLTFTKASPQDIDSISELTAEIFVNSQPLAKCLQLRKQDFYEYVKQNLKTQKLFRSFVAKDDDAIVGVSINMLASDIGVKYSPKWHQNMKMYIDDFEKYEYSFLQDYDLPANKFFYMGMGAIHQHYANIGIFSKLAQMSLIHACELGCEYVIANGTSQAVPQLLTTKLGFEIIKQYKFSEMEGSLTILKQYQQLKKFTMLRKKLPKNPSQLHF